jgi:ABC-type transporter Mla MlaB component
MKDKGLQISDKNGTAQINFSGKLSVITLEPMMPEVNAAIDKFSKFEILINDVENLDLAAMQLFISIKRTLDQEQKTGKFTFDLPQKLRVSITEAQMLSEFNQ